MWWGVDLSEGDYQAPRYSIIIPVLNEEESIVDTLEALQALRAQGVEVIVCDGGSEDGTQTVAEPLADQMVLSGRGRGRQMNAGAAVARSEILLFLHADTRLPAGALKRVQQGLELPGRCWGRFDVKLSGAQPLLRVVEVFINLRSRLSGIATGDQAIFLTRNAFFEVKGFPDIPLMEDIGMSRALKSLAPPLCLRERVVTSSRRWEEHGVIRTVFLMWWLRLSYALGRDPAGLARRYG